MIDRAGLGLGRQRMSEHQQRVDGWKAIAAVIPGEQIPSTRTAQRYARDRGMPIHGTFRGPWALVSEIRRWAGTVGLVHVEPTPPPLESANPAAEARPFERKSSKRRRGP